MDFIELTPCEGKKCCLVIIDMFSKWIEVFPTKHQDALTVAKALTRDIIPRFGIPEIMYSDNGTHFVNQVIHHLALVFDISVKNHCAYHPQSAGLVERTNGTIKSKLKKTMTETGKNWMYCLPLVMLNMHILPGVRGISPFEILYGRPYTLPELKPFIRDDSEMEATLADYMAKMLKRQAITSSVISPSQETADQDPFLKPGDWTFIKVIKRKY